MCGDFPGEKGRTQVRVTGGHRSKAHSESKPPPAAFFPAPPVNSDGLCDRGQGGFSFFQRLGGVLGRLGL